MTLKFEEDLNRKYNTDGLEMREEWEKRKRSDTISTVSPDKHGPKISKVGTIKE